MQDIKARAYKDYIELNANNRTKYLGRLYVAALKSEPNLTRV